MAATAVHIRSPEPARRRRLLRVGDDRLVARVRAGDDAAFEIIYDRYYRGLLAFCGHMLGSRQEAEDVLQQSFASAYRALRAGADAVDLRPWLYTIARNRCLSALRAQRARVSTDALVAGEGPFEGMAAEVQRRADLRDLVEELQRLPDDQRAALVLFELGDESHEQIAAVLGVRREKVKALVFQAREALLRAREAREAPCIEIREQLATLAGRVPRRSLVRSHIDRCPGCADFERGVRRQRAALAAILPFAPTVGLKASVLGLSLGGGGAVALGGAGAGGGATVAAAGAATVATGLATGGGAGLASLPAKGVVAKILAVVALGGAGGANAPVHHERQRHPAASHQPAGPHLHIVAVPSYPPAASRPTQSAAPAAKKPTAPSSSSAPAPTPAPAAAAAAPAASHTPAAPTSAATPTPSAPPSGAAPSSADAAPAPSDAPASTPPANATTAPSAPASSAAPAATTDAGAALPAAPQATVAAPASTSSAAAAAAPSSAAPAADSTPVASSAPAATVP